MVYARQKNPTRQRLETLLAAVESGQGGEACEAVVVRPGRCVCALNDDFLALTGLQLWCNSSSRSVPSLQPTPHSALSRFGHLLPGYEPSLTACFWSHCVGYHGTTNVFDAFLKMRGTAVTRVEVPDDVRWSTAGNATIATGTVNEEVVGGTTDSATATEMETAAQEEETACAKDSSVDGSNRRVGDDSTNGNDALPAGPSEGEADLTDASSKHEEDSAEDHADGIGESREENVFALQPQDLVWIETPSNPFTRVRDIQVVVAAAKGKRLYARLE